MTQYCRFAMCFDKMVSSAQDFSRHSSLLALADAVQQPPLVFFSFRAFASLRCARPGFLA
jgi:hypothetical protein